MTKKNTDNRTIIIRNVDQKNFQTFGILLWLRYDHPWRLVSLQNLEKLLLLVEEMISFSSGFTLGVILDLLFTFSLTENLLKSSIASNEMSEYTINVCSC